MSNPILQKNYVADAAINAARIVKLGTADDRVTLCSAATDLSIGISNEVAPATGERCDIIVLGIAYCEAGAAVTKGSRLTADASGRCIVAAPAAGVNAQIIGVALETASAAGDQIRVLISQSVMQG